ncbi:MAG: SRPBCC family protein [Lewinellaceae bacterium]|nr:SRPBCC family protein [Lewinellaceae bacterium]
MSNPSYHFTTYWLVDGTPEEVYRIIEDVDHLAEWWPSVYLKVKVLEPGAPGGVGKVVDLFTKGWLPYTLRWQFRVTEAHFPNGSALEAWGDFVGSGRWTFQAGPQSDQCQVTYDWRIEATKPILKYFSFLLRPIFSANHFWAMRKGEESIKLELRRRRASSPEERAAIPKPPPPTFRF